LTKTDPAQTLPGFEIRSPEFSDLERCVDLFNRYSQHYLGINEASVEDISVEWTSPGFNPADDIRLVISADGRLVGYIEVWTNRDPPVHPWIWLTIDPGYEGLGIGKALLEWAELRSKDAMDRVPGGLRVAIQCGTVSSIEPARERFERAGFSLLRHNFRMQIEFDQEPPAPRWPDGIKLRSYNPDQDLVQVYKAVNDAFRDHFGYVQQPFESGLERFSHFMTSGDAYDPALWFLAATGDQIVGTCLCSRRVYDDPECGYINILGVSRPWRKKGLALALLHHAFNTFFSRGTRRVGLGVDADNLTGALQLYRKAGMQVLRQFDQYEKEIRPGKEISVQSLES
jgi:mycothiol synthase